VPPVCAADVGHLALAQKQDQYARQSLLDRSGDLGTGEDVGSAPGESACSLIQVQQLRQKKRRRFDNMGEGRCEQLASDDGPSGAATSS